MFKVPCPLGHRAAAWVGVAVVAAGLTACETAPPALPAAPAASAAFPSPAASPAAAARIGPSAADAAPLLRARARWLPVDWSALPAWGEDRLSEWWPAFLRGCEKPAADWAALCAQAQRDAAPAFSDEAAQAWLRQRLQPYRVEALDGAADGLLTGYFEPLVEATRRAQGRFQVPLYGLPADLGTRRPYWTRQQLDTQAAARASVQGRALAFVSDPLDALLLQIQGSGRLQLTEADGSRKLVRLAYAAHNDQPYRSVGRWLIDQGELPAAQASWPAIRQWARQNPQRLNELLWSNPRVVFFREEALPDPQVGPRGAQGVALTPGRSLAVDPLAIPYGTPVWLDSSEPLSATPLRRLTLAQDTGSAITGAVRADYFWGWGGAKEAQAGRTKQPLRLWVLWPRSP